MSARWHGPVLCVLLTVPLTATAGDFNVAESDGDKASAERVGPPTFYGLDAKRYIDYRKRPPERYYPIPRGKVTRETYFKWLEDSGHFEYAKRAGQHAQYGPRSLMPVLARYVKTGERRHGEACITMLKAFHETLKKDVARLGWHYYYMETPGFIGLYRRYLSKGGLLDLKKDKWFRELVIHMNRHIHVWGTPQSFWRGPMHRAQGEGVMKGLAAHWYPDAPEAAGWKKYADTVYQDWWQFKDHPPNDTGYYFGILIPLVLRAELVGDEAFFNDPGMKPIWERLMYEVTPDGAICPYGSHGGWNSTAATRVLMLELAAAHTKDGRYRYAAHKLMNYLLYQQQACRRHSLLDGQETTEKLAAAYLLTDDSIKPVQPDGGSRILYHKETLRLRNKAAAKKYLKDLDPAPDKANICCNLIVTDKTKPYKLVLRSGWAPGDFFALVDLFPRHDPLNVPGIMGMTRHATALTTTCYAKGFSDENRLLIEDLSGTAQLRGNTNPDLADAYYQEVTVPHFKDQKKATFVSVVVTDYMGFPVKLVREFAFIKNRFLVVRDVPEFEEGFLAQVTPVFNTENIGPQIGNHWANTFIRTPKYLDSPLENPPYDLLVYFAPQPGCRMQVVDRTATDLRTTYAPAQLRYRWRGVTRPRQKLVFTQVFYPHPPKALSFSHSASGSGRMADMIGTAGAGGIQVLKDTPGTTVLRLGLDKDRVEWIVCNPSGKKATAGDLATDARFAYVDVVKGKVAGHSATDATFLTLDGKDVFRHAKRQSAEK